MDNTLYAIAISLMSTGLCHFYSTHDAKAIYNECVTSGQRKVQEYFTNWYSSSPLEEAEKIFELCKKLNVSLITYWDDEYPSLLKEIVYPPAVLYCRGVLPKNPCVAIVGTRNADPKSCAIAKQLSKRIAQSGITVVSGLALGIDREAHCGALESGGSTIGVMANGIDMIYPVNNRDIYTDIVNSGNGCVLSEYPPRVRVNRWTFVRRNRIISGLSLGTVVVKAGEKSGALITARFAIEQNRELFVCTGYPFDEGYKGCIALLKEGAHPVYDENDIFETLHVGSVKTHPTLFDKIEKNQVLQELSKISIYEDDDIVKTLKNGAMDIDALIRQSGKSSNEVLEKIAILELEGVIFRSGNTISLYRS